MPEEAHLTPLNRRCLDVVGRLAGAYGWLLDDEARRRLADKMVATHEDDEQASTRALEQTCCRLRFALLHAELKAGGPAAETALEELFEVRWPDDDPGSVRYGGYLFRAALATLRRRLAGSALSPADLEQLACDAASRAVTTVRTRHGDCRDPDAFWGWVSRVAERAAIDELRSGQVTGGRSVHAASLSQTGNHESETGDPAPSSRTAALEAEERHVDALAVRDELLRKCRLGKLSVDQREALVRSFWGGEKPHEVAAALSAERGRRVTAAQVSLWKHRGLQVMEANLREHGFS